MDKQKQDDQLELTHNSTVPIQDVALKTYQKPWTMEKGGRRGSRKYVLMERHNIYIYTYIRLNEYYYI